MGIVNHGNVIESGIQQAVRFLTGRWLNLPGDNRLCKHKPSSHVTGSRWVLCTNKGGTAERFSVLFRMESRFLFILIKKGTNMDEKTTDCCKNREQLFDNA